MLKTVQKIVYVQRNHEKLQEGSLNHTGCLKIREFRIQSVVGDHLSSANMEIKKSRDSPHKDKLI
jgi:hypothetical protein